MWEVRVYLGRDPRTGQVKHLSKTVHGSARDADSVLHDLIAKYGGESADGVRATFSQLLDLWLEECERLDRSPKTVRNYRVQMDKTIRPALGKVKVSRLSARHLDERYGVMKERGAAPKTIRNYHVKHHPTQAGQGSSDASYPIYQAFLGSSIGFSIPSCASRLYVIKKGGQASPGPAAPAFGGRP